MIDAPTAWAAGGPAQAAGNGVAVVAGGDLVAGRGTDATACRGSNAVTSTGAMIACLSRHTPAGAAAAAAAAGGACSSSELTSMTSCDTPSNAVLARAVPSMERTAADNCLCRLTRNPRSLAAQGFAARSPVWDAAWGVAACRAAADVRLAVGTTAAAGCAACLLRGTAGDRTFAGELASLSFDCRDAAAAAGSTLSPWEGGTPRCLPGSASRRARTAGGRTPTWTHKMVAVKKDLGRREALTSERRRISTNGMSTHALAQGSC
jgi:hypothetical protein